MKKAEDGPDLTEPALAGRKRSAPRGRGATRPHPGARPRRAADDAADAARQDRRERALALRIEGRSLREVARDLGISYEQARTDIARAVQERGRESREQLRARGNGALETVFRGLLQKALAGDPPSAAVVVRAVREHARINGYAAAATIKHEVAGVDGAAIRFTLDEALSVVDVSDENERSVATLAARGGASEPAH